MAFGWLVGVCVCVCVCVCVYVCVCVCGGGTSVNKTLGHFHHKVHNFKFLLRST